MTIWNFLTFFRTVVAKLLTLGVRYGSISTPVYELSEVALCKPVAVVVSPLVLALWVKHGSIN